MLSLILAVNLALVNRTRYNALKMPDSSGSSGDDSDRGDGVRTLRDMLSRDIRIMQYVSSNADGTSSMGSGGISGGTEYPSSHIKVEVSDLYRRKRELGTQIKELESALLGSGTGGGSGGDLSSDLVRIIEEQFKMYENIAAKVAVIHRRVEEEKQAIRAELRANPDGKGDPWCVCSGSPFPHPLFGSISLFSLMKIP